MKEEVVERVTLVPKLTLLRLAVTDGADSDGLTVIVIAAEVTVD